MENQSIIQNLVKFYGPKQVLKGINLEVAAGQIVGYIGPNGAGKSTTIKIMIGLLGDYAGEVQILGFDVKKDALEVKKRIGYVPENAALYEVLTPAEYLMLMGKLHDMNQDNIKKKTKELLDIVGLSDNINNRMNTFSKGMRQKVSLVAGLIHNPEVVFMDEPLSGLDANAVILVKEILSQLKAAGKTIFYSSHIMDVVERLCDRIIIINGGQVIADGSFDELKNQNHSQNLEKIFNDLTGNDEYTTQARDFAEALKN